MADLLRHKTNIKSMWVEPAAGEEGAPRQRIIHAMIARPANGAGPVGFTGPARVGVRLGEGYFKCGSEQAVDWITEFRAFAWQQESWQPALCVTGLQKPAPGQAPTWFDLPVPASAYLFQARRSGIDDWWPCFNIAKTGFVFEARGEAQPVTQPPRRLHRVSGAPDLAALADEGIEVTRASTFIRYRSPYYAIGLRLKSAGLEFLALDGAGAGQVAENLLALPPLPAGGENDFFTQGPLLVSLDGAVGCGFLAYNLEGETQLDGRGLVYRLKHAASGLCTELAFTFKRDRIEIQIQRVAEKTIRLLDSAVFRVAFNARAIPLTALGPVIRAGETGALALPLTLHLPGRAGVRVSAEGPVTGRFNSIRPDCLNTFDFELGEQAGEDGCRLIQAGTYHGRVTLQVGLEQHIPLAADTPTRVVEAFGRYLYTSLPFRADTATFSNNGNSMGAPICLDVWAELCQEIGSGPAGVDAFAFLRSTIEIHLLGAPAYAAGMHHSGQYAYEDEYLMTGAAVLLGIARYLEAAGAPAWWAEFGPRIKEKITLLRGRDVDGDGLIESTLRCGVTGEHQWSTCWYDVISYGYKDAFSNALLYAALRALADSLPRFGEPDLAAQLAHWAGQIQAVYASTFLTPNGWLAGWKCAQGRLHDYGFLAVNGAAAACGLLEGAAARVALDGLWRALVDSGFDSFDLGLPGNVFPIANEDMAAFQHWLPFGGYQNGGVTLSQARHFINGLTAVGMRHQADFLMNQMCSGLLSGSVIGGVGSGVDWKTWDGLASGYEGLLCDQLGIFQPLLRRFRKVETSIEGTASFKNP